MATRDKDPVDQKVATFANEVNEARRQAVRSMFQFDELEQVANIDPGQVSSSEVDKAHWNFQRSVILYYTYIYPYVQASDSLLQKDLTPNAEENTTLNTLMSNHGGTEVTEVDCSDAFDHNKVEEREVPKLQPPNALRNAVHVLNQVALKLGFLPHRQVEIDNNARNRDGF